MTFIRSIQNLLRNIPEQARLISDDRTMDGGEILPLAYRFTRVLQARGVAFVEWCTHAALSSMMWALRANSGSAHPVRAARRAHRPAAARCRPPRPQAVRTHAESVACCRSVSPSQ